MCNFWSAILTRDGRVLWDKEIVNHTELITKFGLTDTKLLDRDFVRIEITPKNILSKKKSDWTYKLDEEKTAPDWYANDPARMEKTVWKEWKNMLSQMHQGIRDAGVHLDRFERILDRLKMVDLKDAPVVRATVRAAIGEHVKRLSATDPQHRNIVITAVEFHTLMEWDQLRGQLWGQLRGQLWDQLRGHLWDQLRGHLWGHLWDQLWDQFYSALMMDDDTDPWCSLIDALESGCLLMGITKDGVAHVVMVGKEDR
jgi:hypothetical protein